VALVADVDTVIEGVPWQIVVADGTGTVGVVTLAVTTTDPVAQVVALHVPEALT
jgi:hypothetical protein